ncbi:MAG: hypothetical protein JWP46_1983 [Modestobacter sp.]|nr:hypothetical protein [Modestobacter sp.]
MHDEWVDPAVPGSDPGAGAGTGSAALLAARRGGTRSTPPGCQGAHFASRRRASQLPRAAPCTSIASTAYALQVGANRHRGGSTGLTAR